MMTRSVALRVLVVTLVLAAECPSILWPATTQAQPGDSGSRTTATIRGAVLDWKKNGVANAKITIENSKLKRQTKTDERGHFVVRVPAGVYRLTVEANGFKRYVFESFSVRRYSIKRVNVPLELGVPNDRDLVPSPTPR
jgi:hypothetical protein